MERSRGGVLLKIDRLSRHEPDLAPARVPVDIDRARLEAAAIHVTAPSQRRIRISPGIGPGIEPYDFPRFVAGQDNPFRAVGKLNAAGTIPGLTVDGQILGALPYFTEPVDVSPGLVPAEKRSPSIAQHRLHVLRRAPCKEARADVVADHDQVLGHSAAAAWLVRVHQRE